MRGYYTPHSRITRVSSVGVYTREGEGGPHSYATAPIVTQLPPRNLSPYDSHFHGAGWDSVRNDQRIVVNIFELTQEIISFVKLRYFCV